MKTGAGLALIAVGAILAFAVNATPSWLNLHTVGWVLMLVGLIGLVLPKRTYGWLGRRIQSGGPTPAAGSGRRSATTRPPRHLRSRPAPRRSRRSSTRRTSSTRRRSTANRRGATAPSTARPK